MSMGSGGASSKRNKVGKTTMSTFSKNIAENSPETMQALRTADELTYDKSKEVLYFEEHEGAFYTASTKGQEWTEKGFTILPKHFPNILTVRVTEGGYNNRVIYNQRKF